MGARTVVKAAVGRAARSPAFDRALGAVERLGPGRAGALPVLAYHRIDDPGATGLYPGLVSAEPDEFARQVAHLASRYRVLSLGDLLDVRRGREPLPRRALLLTFDDAYRDFAEHAWPVLREHGLPVTLFVPTAFVGEPERPFWWDRLYASLVRTEELACETSLGRWPLGSSAERLDAYRALRTRVKALAHEQAMAVVDEVVARLGEASLGRSLLDWNELRGLAAEGVTLAPHTRTHPLLNRVSLAEAEAEVVGSHADLEREIGTTPRVLAYPSGACSGAVAAMLERCRFELAFTIMRHGVNRLPAVDWLRLRRINVSRSLPLPLLRTSLLPLASRVATANPDSTG